MTDHDDSSQWWGTSDAPATLRRRAQSTPTQRWRELTDLVELAVASGALDRTRQAKQASLEGWPAPAP